LSPAVLTRRSRPEPTTACSIDTSVSKPGVGPLRRLSRAEIAAGAAAAVERQAASTLARRTR
jgi:hypothetical protein